MTLIEDLRTIATPALSEVLQQQGEEFMAIINDSVPPELQGKILGLYKSAADYRAKAMTATDPGEARLNLDLSQTAIRRIKTLALGHAAIKSEETAEWLARTGWAILDTGAKVAQGMLKAVVAGAVQGGIAGFTGGSAPAIGGAMGAALEVFRGK